MSVKRDKSEPLYQQIYTALKDRIVTGAYATGSAFPPERKLRDEFGVSHLTVRKALAQLVRERLIERRSGAGTVVTYAANAFYSTRRTSSTVTTIALIVEEADDFFSRIINSVERECRSRGLVMALFCHHCDNELQKLQYERATADKNALAVLMPSGAHLEFLAFHPALARTIIVDDCVPGLAAPQIISDDETGMFSAVKYLADLGHRTVGCISSEAKTTGRNRLRGYQRAVRELGLAQAATLVENGHFNMDRSAHACQAILSRHADCTALVCANDYSAFGAARHLKAQGRTPGVDFSLVGYGNYDISEALELTSVDQQIDRIRAQIMVLVDEYRDAGRMAPGVFSIPTELRIRSSCVACAGSRRTLG